MLESPEIVDIGIRDRDFERPSLDRLHPGLEDSASIKAALHDGPLDHLVVASIMRLSTTVKDFAIAEAERLSRIKLIGYVEAVSAALQRLKPTSSIVLFAGVSKTNPYPGS